MAEPSEPGTDLRFSLASERTLLAYQRTAVALMVASVGLAHFLDDGVLLLLLCLALVAGAGIAAVGGHRRFVDANRAADEGRPLASSPVPVALTGVLAFAVVLSVIMVVTKAG